jgi:chemotaxis response regulator CheB
MNGGLLMVQDTATAIAKSMPAAVAESGEAHVMATSQAMAEILARTYKRHKDARLL